jgi:signal peptidase I
MVGLGAVAIGSGKWHLTPVLSGSMSPGLPTGSLAVTERVPISEVRVRDVIVIHRPDDASKLLVHRVVAVAHTSNGIVINTQGDANPVQDPWQAQLRGLYAYKVRFSIPLVGYAAVASQRGHGRFALLGFGLLIVVLMVSAFVRELRRHRRLTAASDIVIDLRAEEARRDRAPQYGASAPYHRGSWLPH